MPNPTRCTFCGRGPLRWAHDGDRYRLRDAHGWHQCGTPADKARYAALTAPTRAATAADFED